VIAVEARGRLGNNMFQFAFGLAAADRLGTEFVFAEDELRRHFSLSPHDGLAGRIRRSVGFRVTRAFAPFPVEGVDGFAEPAAVLRGLTDRTTYTGFFQSERYFAHIRDRVLRAFTPRPEHERELERRYGDLLAGGYTCCHVRATDYREWEGGRALPPSYYRAALHAVGERRRPVVFVGDDLDEVRRSFTGPGVRFEHNSPSVDLLLIVRATTVVTSNSSFGWWGAWLGDRGRQIVAPRHWLGFKQGQELPREVVPSWWVQLPVDPGE
jgi:hypothetical protein